MYKNVVKDGKTEELLKEIDNIYGATKCKEVMKNYVTYLKLKKEEKINFGTYNILIKNTSEYELSKQLVDIICKILKANEIIKTSYNYLDRDEIRRNRNKNEKKKRGNFKADLLIIDSKKIDSDICYMKSEIKELMLEFPNKVFIVIDNDSNSGRGFWGFEEDDEIESYFCNLINWNMKIEKISKENKSNYIEKFLKQNKIQLDKENTFVDSLSDEPYWKVKNELLNVVLECKARNIEKITDDVVKQELKSEYYKKGGRKKKSKKSAIQELESMIGMEEVKDQVKQIINYVRVNKKREKMPMLHMCFLGNPGTGKTTVARILGRLFYEEEILSKKEKFIEVHGRDLIAKYVGWTASTTKNKVKEAEGGVLFIDEAYSLNPRDHSGFEDECIATLLKEMEDKREDLCVILAGYGKEMDEMLKTNPGFESRIQFRLKFPDYTEEELYKIFKQIAKKDDYKLSSNIKPILMEYFQKEKKKENFANARCVRNLFEKVKFEQADRVAKNDNEDFYLIKKCDVESVICRLEEPKVKSNKIGFAN